jgi:YVTN family beta-propeller protein
MRFKTALLAAAGLLIGIAGYGTTRRVWQDISQARMGKQPDGSYIVSTEQRVEPGAIAFDGRPIDLALHPSGAVFAVLGQANVLLGTRDGILPGSSVPLGTGAAYRGILWSPDGTRLFVSTSAGTIQTLRYDGKQLTPEKHLIVMPSDPNNPRPGGMCITRDGTRLFVVACDQNAVSEIDLTTDQWVRAYPVQNLPFEVQLSQDEKTLIVSNWAGRKPEQGDDESLSGDAMVVVDPRGVPASGTVSLVNRATGRRKDVVVGLHPTDIAVQGDTAYVANAASDSISVLDVPRAAVTRTIPIKWGDLNTFGSMPCALALRGQTLYVCNGGDNAVCELDLASNAVRGFRPAGYYPTAIALSADGGTAYVLNTKGNGSVRRTGKGEIGNVHDFQGTVSVVDLKADLKAATARVADNNLWNRDRGALRPDLAVYRGAIKHVLYIIKENRTYDEVLGDMPQGNGDPKICDLGKEVTPNAHALVQQFTLFDNAYVSGTNSADGHTWSTQALCNDYLEHFYAGYRTYPDDGDCAMSRSSAGFLWDAAFKAHRTLRNYGEYCDEDLATFTPQPKNWMDVWKDRMGAHRMQIHVGTLVPELKPYTNPHFVYWPLLQSDQQRADIFIQEYQEFSREDKVPDLTVMALPCDHTEGRNPDYPEPRSMVADNDLALGRIVEAVSHSPQWKDTCIFVIEDDAQSGPDHVDGHRTVYMAFSPYVRHGFVDHTLCNTVSMIRSIELMLGMEPLNRFDALTPPLSTCFTDMPDPSTYTVQANHIALDTMNPPLSSQRGAERYWTRRSMALDWSGPDRADPAVLNQVLWHTLHGMNSPYPFAQPKP